VAIPAVGSALEQWQTELITLYRGTSAITDLVTGIFDYVPQNQPFPYIHLGEPTEQPMDTFSTPGYSVGIEHHVWSEAKGHYEIYRIIRQINLAIFGATFSLDDGLIVCNLNHEMTNVMIQPDGIVRHGVVSYNAFIQEP
jgi:hypothetical protein